MEIYSLGRIAPDSPGTPAPLTTDDDLMVHAVIVSQSATSTSRTVFGRVGLDKDTLAGVIKEFDTPGGNGMLDTLKLVSCAGNAIQLSKYVVDADTGGDGLLVA